jgi:hypothetical protein
MSMNWFSGGHYSNRAYLAYQAPQQQAAKGFKRPAMLAEEKPRTLTKPRLPRLHAMDWQRFGAVEPLPVIYQASFRTQDDASLLSPKGQMCKLSEVLKEMLVTLPEKQALPDQVVVQLCYEQEPPVDRIKQTLMAREKQARAGGWKMNAARLLLGMPDKFPPMDFKQCEDDKHKIQFTLDTSKLEREELGKFATFLGKSVRYLESEY